MSDFLKNSGLDSIIGHFSQGNPSVVASLGQARWPAPTAVYIRTNPQIPLIWHVDSKKPDIKRLQGILKRVARHLLYLFSNDDQKLKIIKTQITEHKP